MENIINKLENLKEEIDNIEEVEEIKDLNKKIHEDKELNKLINQYKETQDESIKKEILNNSLFQKYKDKELDINIIIMKINNELKQIKDKGHCNI